MQAKPSVAAFDGAQGVGTATGKLRHGPQQEHQTSRNRARTASILVDFDRLWRSRAVCCQLYIFVSGESCTETAGKRYSPSCTNGIAMIRVLVLEDDAAAAESSCRMLKQGGLACSFERVESEADFREALRRVPDVILSDSNVPGFEGLSALAIAQAERPAVPFIFVTGNPDPAAALVARERGAAGVVPKT